MVLVCKLLVLSMTEFIDSVQWESDILNLSFCLWMGCMQNPWQTDDLLFFIMIRCFFVLSTTARNGVDFLLPSIRKFLF